MSGYGNVNLATAAAEPVTLSVGNNNQNTFYEGALSGGNGLTKVGSGTLTLSAAQGYSGPTVVSGGVLKLMAPGVSAQWTTGGNYSLSSSAAAGAVPLANWNVITVPNANTLTTLSTVQDASGNTAGSLSLSFSSSGKDPADGGGGYATPIQQLLNAGLTAHNGDSGGGYGKNAISISNIPYSSYSLYVYASNWSGDAQLTDDLKMNQNANGYTAGKCSVQDVCRRIANQLYDLSARRAFQ